MAIRVPSFLEMTVLIAALFGVLILIAASYEPTAAALLPHVDVNTIALVR